MLERAAVHCSSNAAYVAKKPRKRKKGENTLKPKKKIKRIGTKQPFENARFVRWSTKTTHAHTKSKSYRDSYSERVTSRWHRPLKTPTQPLIPLWFPGAFNPHSLRQKYEAKKKKRRTYEPLKLQIRSSIADNQSAD